MSPLSDILVSLDSSIENPWVSSELDRAGRGRRFKKNLIHSLFDSYYSGTREKFVFDKSRAWSLKDRSEILQKYFDVKMIVMERDISDVCKSYIRIHLENGFTLEESEKNILNLDSWGGYPILLPVAGLINSKINNNGQYLHVDYDQLVSDPHGQINRIYEFCNIPYFEHNLSHIADLSYEDKDKQLDGMIEVRSRIEKRTYDVELSPKAEQRISFIKEILEPLNSVSISKRDRERAQRFYALNAI